MTPRPLLLDLDHGPRVKPQRQVREYGRLAGVQVEQDLLRVADRAARRVRDLQAQPGPLHVNGDAHDRKAGDHRDLVVRHRVAEHGPGVEGDRDSSVHLLWATLALCAVAWRRDASCHWDVVNRAGDAPGQAGPGIVRNSRSCSDDVEVMAGDIAAAYWYAGWVASDGEANGCHRLRGRLDGWAQHSAGMFIAT
jgi:hypothetical protein